MDSQEGTMCDNSSQSADEDSDPNLFSENLDNPVFDTFEQNNVDENSDALGQQYDLLQDPLPDPSSEEHTVSNGEVHRGLKICKAMKRLMSRPVFLGIISLYGKTRYTLENYEHLVAMMKDGDEGIHLPCATTMRKFVFPRLVNSLFVKSSIESFSTNSNYSSYLSRSTNLSKRQSEAVVVLPSSWAKLDISSLHILRELVCVKECRCHRLFGSSDLRVDTTSHVLNRIEHSRNSDTLWVSKDGIPVPSLPGIIIKLHTSDEEVVSNVHYTISEFRYKQEKFRGEVCTAFEAELISTLHVRFSSERGVYVEEGFEPHLTDENFKSKYRSCLDYISTLCQPHHQFSSDTNYGSGEQTYRGSAQTRRQLQRQQHACRNQINNKSSYLVPSDHLAVVKFGSTESMGVLVSRFWVERLDDERNFFLFINNNGNEDLSSTPITTFGAPVLVRETPVNTSRSPKPKCRTTGLLPNGMRFYFYRLILYADDFNPRSSLFPKGSVGGMYMSPSSFSVRSRRSQTTIRTISVTPAGVSTNSVIDFIIEDLVTGCTDGFICVDAFGEQVTVFFDIMGFIGDYPASSAVVDLKGHNATAPCTHCGFTFNKSPGMPIYAFTTSVTSRNTAYRRTQERTASIREVGLTKNQATILGMSDLQKEDVFRTSACPLLKFASSYNEASKRNDHPPGFTALSKDGYTLNLIAPDHLITGLFKGLLTITFIQLPDNTARDKLQICLRSSLSEFGFQSQFVLFNNKKKKLVPGLSMSILYCILTVLPSTLQALKLLDQHPAKQIVMNLNRLFSLAFWWPTFNHDGQQAWKFVHGSHMHLYHRSLQILASNFVKSVRTFSKSYSELSRHVDKPNIHRLLELVQHTIPTFNHVAYICELVFESAHQPLKFFLSRNHTLNSHIHSVQLILAKDWMVRLWCLWCIHKDNSESSEYRQYAFLGILRLLVGNDIDTINWKLEALSETLNEMKEHVYYLMNGTVEKRFSTWYQEYRMTVQAEACWELNVPPKGHTFSVAQRVFLDRVVAHLSQGCLQNEKDLELCHKALLNRGFGSSGKSSHERMEIGDVVQVLLNSGFEQKRFLSTFICNNGEPKFFVIGGFIRSRSGISWAVVKRCTLLSPSVVGQMTDFSLPPLIQISTQDFYTSLESSHHFYLQLSGDIRKVGVLHDCSRKGNCTFSFDTRRVTHCSTTLQTGSFFIITRSMAYPPRRS